MTGIEPYSAARTMKSAASVCLSPSPGTNMVMEMLPSSILIVGTVISPAGFSLQGSSESGTKTILPSSVLTVP